VLYFFGYRAVSVDKVHYILAEFPALMSSCTINWMDQWPDDALNFVALRFLGDIDFRLVR
jgi:hypothetical protein